MINEKDIQTLNGRLHKQEYKDLAIRLFAVSLLGSTTITAPEIQKCLMILENYLNMDFKEPEKVENRSPAK